MTGHCLLITAYWPLALTLDFPAHRLHLGRMSIRAKIFSIYGLLRGLSEADLDPDPIVQF